MLYSQNNQYFSKNKPFILFDQSKIISEYPFIHEDQCENYVFIQIWIVCSVLYKNPLPL